MKQYDHKNSVKVGELASPYVFWIPQRSGDALPPQLPVAPLTPILGLYPNDRDRVLISTVYYESMWASVIGIQASRFAVSGWSIEGSRPRIQAMTQEILTNSTVGIIRGWIPFASAGMASICNPGKWIVEVERWTSRSGSRVKALHHLDPSRCWVTSDPERPIFYIDTLGRAHEMRDYQVMIMMDLPDTTELAINSPVSAGVRAYPKITQLAALDTYISEKITGRRPLAVNFIQGLSKTTLQDTLTAADNEADKKGAVAYMGSVMAGVMGDTPINLITIPLADIPDGIDADALRKSAHLVYANALGDDPAGIDPALIGNRQLGAGTQATVLDDRASRGGVTNILMQQWTHAMNNLMRGEKIQFAFSTRDLRDQKQAAEVSKIRADTRKVQIEAGEITAKQATNIAVDAGDLPPEYLVKDETASLTVSDDENPEMAITAQDDAGEAIPEEDVPEEAMKSAPMGHPFYGNQHVSFSRGTFGTGGAPKTLGDVGGKQSLSAASAILGRSKRQRAKDVEELAKLPVEKLRSNQAILQSQMNSLYEKIDPRNPDPSTDKVFRSLQARLEDTSAAIDKKIFQTKAIATPAKDLVKATNEEAQRKFEAVKRG